MSCTTLTTSAIEGGTYVISFSFTDEDGDPVTPNQLSWTLTDDEGNVINSREDVVISPPAASVDVLLQGDDLDPGDSKLAELIFTIEGTYNSDLGSNLPIVAQCKLPVDGLLP